jgi:hypothetical protein
MFSTTVCVDAAYYTVPSVKYLEGLASQVSVPALFIVPQKSCPMIGKRDKIREIKIA